FVLNGFSVAIGDAEPVPLGSVKMDDGSASIENFRWGIDATRDQPARLRRQAVFVSARPFAPAGAPLRITIKTIAPVGQALGRFRVSVTASPSPLRVVGVSARLRPALLTPRAKRTPQQAKDLAAQFRAVSPIFKATRDRVDALQKSLRDLGIVTAMVMKEKADYDRPSTWVRRRGNFLDRTEQVYAAVPSFLPSLPESVMPNRLGLAGVLVGALARGRAESADTARHREPRVGAVLRERARRNERRLRSAGRGAVASRAARLAGGEIRRAGLASEAAAPGDRDVGDLSSVVRGDARARGKGSLQSAPPPRPAVPRRGRNGPRHRP